MCTIIETTPLALIAALLTAAPAYAGMKVNPPEEYDRPYRGELVIVQKEGATDRCPVTQYTFVPVLGCAFINKTENRCLVLLAPDELIRSRGWTTEIVKRHEIGHCNGWPANHEGAR